MEVTLSGNGIKLFNKAVASLSKVGAWLLLRGRSALAAARAFGGARARACAQRV